MNNTTTDHYNSKIHNAFYIGKYIRQVDQDVRRHGLHTAMREIVRRSKSRLHIHLDHEDTYAVLKNKPVVIVSNHPYDADVVALIASLPDRGDAYLVINSHFIGISPAFDSYFIPVYIRHHFPATHSFILQGKFLSTYLAKPPMSPDEEHIKNVKSISIASKRLAKGSAVIIFPGKKPEDGHWYTGIGHMIAGVKNLKDVFVVNAHIRGTSNIDYFRLLPAIGVMLPTISVSLSAPMHLGHTIKNRDGKQIAWVLEKQYLDWVNGLSA